MLLVQSKNLLIFYRICIEERDESIIVEEEEHANSSKPQLSHFSSAFDIRNTRWIAFYLRIKKQSSGNTSQSKIGWNSYPYQKRVFHEIAYTRSFSDYYQRGGGGGGKGKEGWKNSTGEKKASGYCVRCFVTKIRS